MVGIYKITNSVNNKIYIGQSVNIERRFAQHRYDAKHEDRQNGKLLYKDIKKYGIDKFQFEIIEECSKDELNKREKHYIKVYNSNAPNGYNKTIGGVGSPCYKKLSTEIILKIIERLKTSMDSAEIIALEFEISPDTVRSINSGRICRICSEEYPIRRHLSTIRKEANENSIKTAKKKYTKKVNNRPPAFDLAQDIVINGFECVGRKYNVSGNAIRKRCVSYGIPKTKTELREWLIYQC